MFHFFLYFLLSFFLINAQGKSNIPAKPLNEKVYLKVKNQSQRVIKIKEGLFWKTEKILQPGEKLVQAQINKTINDLQIFYKKGNVFIMIPDHHCHSKFFLSTYEATVKENEYNTPQEDEEESSINMSIPPFNKLSPNTQKYYNDPN